MCWCLFDYYGQRLFFWNTPRACVWPASPLSSQFNVTQSWNTSKQKIWYCTHKSGVLKDTNLTYQKMFFACFLSNATPLQSLTIKQNPNIILKILRLKNLYKPRSLCLPWYQQYLPSCRYACKWTEELGLWRKRSRYYFFFKVLFCWKAVDQILTDVGMIYDFTHHVCGRAWQTCTWFPSSCLLCLSWCLITGLRDQHK